MCLIYFLYCHNLCFFVIDKLIFVSILFLNNLFLYHFSNNSLSYFSNTHDIPQVLQRRTFQWREDYIQEVGYSGLWYQKFPRILEYLDLSNILLSHAQQSSYSVYFWPWTDISLRLFLAHLNIWFWLSNSTKGVSFSYCMDPSLVSISSIFLFETLYLDAGALGVSDPWTTYVIALRRYSCLMVTRRRKCNRRVFARPGLGDFHDDNT